MCKGPCDVVRDGSYDGSNLRSTFEASAKDLPMGLDAGILDGSCDGLRVHS